MAWTDARDRAIGAANQENVHRLLASLAMYPLTQLLGCVTRAVSCPKRVLVGLTDQKKKKNRRPRMSLADVQLLVAQARREADNPALKVCVWPHPPRRL